jgi:curved DNA-binding protein
MMNRKSPDNAGAFRDYYEALQLSPNADSDTIDRVYRILVKRYHPDNYETGNAEKFNEILEAHRVLSDPEKRAGYDVRYDENRAATLKIFHEASASDGFDDDRRVFEGVLSLLYISRRRDPSRGGMGIIQIERLLGCPAQHLEFHLWYLREKGWIERLDNGLLAITANGVDHVIDQDNLILRRDRLIAEGSSVKTDPATSRMTDVGMLT